MKVLHIIKTLRVGGAELHLLTLCRALKRLGVDVTVAHLVDTSTWGTRSLGDEFRAEHIRVLDLGAGGWRQWGLPGRLARVLDTERPDVVHSHLPRGDVGGFLAHWLRPSIPWVCSLHNVYGPHSRAWSGRRFLWLYRRIWRNAGVVIAISQAVREWLVRDVGVAASRVRVIHYGIESGQFEAPAAGSGASGQAVIGSVGRLEERKGHDCLIRAMPAILREVPQAQLRIAGNDPWGYGGTLRALVDRLHLDGHVKLVGFRDDVASFLRETDVFAFASRSEGFGQVVIEAMAAARPVVVSNISPLTEIVVDGQTGVLVDPGSPERFALAITRLLTNPDDMQRLGRSGQAHVEREFSARAMAERTLSVYEEVTARAMSVRSH